MSRWKYFGTEMRERIGRSHYMLTEKFAVWKRKSVHKKIFPSCFKRSSYITNWEVYRLIFGKFSLGLNTKDSSHEHRKATDSEK